MLSVAALLALIGLFSMLPTGGEWDTAVAGDYVVGDTVHYSIAVPDTNSNDIDPSALTLILMTRSGIEDSTKTKAGGGLTKLIANVYTGSYIIPANLGASERTELSAFVRYTGGGKTDVLGPFVSPRSVTVGAAVADSFTNAAVLDMSVQASSASWACIDSAGVSGCIDGPGIYLSGSPVSGAAVWVTNNSTWSANTILAYDFPTVAGDYNIGPVPINSAAIDTFFVWAWYQNQWLESGTQVIIP